MLSDFTAIGPRFSNTVLQTLLVLLAKRPPKDRRLLIIATSSLRPVLTDLGISEAFDSEMRVPPISSLRAVVHVLDELEIFPNETERAQLINMMQQAGLGKMDAREDDTSSRLNIGVKKLLSIAEMARQEPDETAERLTQSLMGLGM